MRLIHTSDWHLGQSLHGHERHAEHRQFLDWLLEELQRREVDALLIAGDIFDQANPSAEAQQLYYAFLGQAVRRCPGLDVVVIAGNHDSPARIDAPDPVLRSLGVRAIGRFRQTLDQSDPFARVRIPLHNRHEEVAAWVLALPFLRPGDLPRGSGDSYALGIATVYRQAVDAALAVRTPKQALLAMGHLHVAGGQVSEDSERKLIMGGEEAVSAGLFPAELAYVALGHLHLAQSMGDPRVRYCGSPLPLSFNEIDYPHQVVEIETEGPDVVATRVISVPRPAPLLRIPATHRPLNDVLALLRALPSQDGPIGLQPLLEVLVERAYGDPDPAPRIRAVLEGRGLRLATIRALRPQELPGSETQSGPRLSLEELLPEPLFARLVQEKTGAAPDSSLLKAFGELLRDAEAGPG